MIFDSARTRRKREAKYVYRAKKDINENAYFENAFVISFEHLRWVVMRIIFVVNKKQTEVEITSLLGTKRNAAPPRHFVINSLRVITFVFRINKE